MKDIWVVEVGRCRLVLSASAATAAAAAARHGGTCAQWAGEYLQHDGGFVHFFRG